MSCIFQDLLASNCVKLNIWIRTINAVYTYLTIVLDILDVILLCENACFV